MKHLFLLFALLFSHSVLFAQFQGKISYEITDSNGKKDDLRVVMDKDNLRILASKTPKSGFESLGLSGEDVIIRFKNKQIVVLQEDKTALVIAVETFKALIDGLSSMTGETINTNVTPPKVTLTKTGKTSSVVGYKVEQVVVLDQENPDEEIHMWVTPSITYRWQNFNDLMAASGFGEQVDFVYYMGDDYLPLKVERFKKGKLQTTVLATTISDRSLGSEAFEVPKGYTERTFQEYFQMMLMKSMMGDGK